MSALCSLTTLTDEQKSIIYAARQGHSTFITGAAGTGKSYVVKQLLKTLPKNGLFATSSTGISSVQLGGVTVHPYVGIGNSAAPDDVLITRVLNNKSAVERVNTTDVLLLDEGSMISLRLFEMLNRIFKLVRGNDCPFGGIQLIFIADFCQLAPVPNHYDEGKYCFLSPLWSVMFPSSHCFLLTKIFRQNNMEFIRLLNEVRLSPSLPEWVQNKLEELKRVLKPVSGKETPRLNSKVIDCFIFNREELHSDIDLDDIKVIYSIDSGTLSSGHMDQLMPVPHALAIKIGSPVMLLRNTDNQLKNGSRGFVEYFISNFPVVFFPKENRVKFFSEQTRVSWTTTSKGKIGTRLQLPLSLSYSFSIHKSQSLGLERGELNVNGIFAAGQLYTGLSRFESFESLRVLNFVKGKTKNIVSKDVINFNTRLKPCDTTFSSTFPAELGCCPKASSVRQQGNQDGMKR